MRQSAISANLEIQLWRKINPRGASFGWRLEGSAALALPCLIGSSLQQHCLPKWSRCRSRAPLLVPVTVLLPRGAAQPPKFYWHHSAIGSLLLCRQL